jgi:hypothetical protein
VPSADTRRHRWWPAASERAPLVIYISTIVLLIAFETWGKPWAFQRDGWDAAVGRWLGPGAVEYEQMRSFQYWGVASLLLRVCTPAAIVVLWLREPLASYGFTLRVPLRTLRPYALAFSAMLPVLLVASAFPSFQRRYPLYPDAARGGWHFWGYQLFYAAQFLGVEAFFRGFALFGWSRSLGRDAVWVLTIPYVMVHFGKPLPEVFAAIIAGWLLGTWALRSGSFIGGWLLHCAVAISMDLLVLGRQLGAHGLIERLFATAG